MQQGARLEDSKYLLEKNVARTIDTLLGSLLTERPTDLLTHTAQWAMKALPVESRRELVVVHEAYPSEEQLLRRLGRNVSTLTHNQLAVNSSYDVYTDPNPKTPHYVKVIATLGPSSTTVDAIRLLIRAGMNVARINLAHIKEQEEVKLLVGNIRAAAKEEGDTHIGIAIDTRGNVVRTGQSTAIREVRRGERVIFQNKSDIDFPETGAVYVSMSTVNMNVPVGTTMYVDDGRLQLRVVSVTENRDWGEITCDVTSVSHVIQPGKVVHFDTLLNNDLLNEKDLEDLKTLVPSLEVDYIFVTGVRTSFDVESVRRKVPESIQVFSKISNPQALANLQPIIDASDGIVIWRAELGLSFPIENMFLIQKNIISTCNVAGRPVVCATHMLDSMTKNPRPTRAEASDAANAILDGTDCVLLSAETASGIYPDTAVRTMVAIIREAQASVCAGCYAASLRLLRPHPLPPMEGICSAVAIAVKQVGAVAIVASSAKGNMIRGLAQYAPACPILAICKTAANARRVSHLRGALPLLYPGDNMDRELRMNFGISEVVKRGIGKPGDHVILVHADHHTSQGSGYANVYRIVVIPTAEENS